MLFKLLGVAAPALLGGLYVTGAFGASGWNRDVARPRAEVMNGLEDFDIRDQPGSPDISRSTGLPSVFRLERTGDSMRWVVTNGNKVALTMVADFTPIDGGRQTHVTAHVERGDAPDDMVAPAFRSRDIALGLFSAALEGQLNTLARPAYAGFSRDPGACARLFRHFQEENLAAGATGQPAAAKAAAATRRLLAYDARQRQLGCQHSVGGSEIAANDGPSGIAGPENPMERAPSR